jgi:HlyD family secretion protein
MALVAFSCAPGGSGDRGPERVIPAVEAVQARHGSLPLSERLSGVVQAVNQVDIYPQVDAVVSEVLVNDGDTVRRGQPLVRLEDREFRQRLKQAEASQRIAQAELRQAEAAAREARTHLERFESLARNQMVSAAELETARARAETAEADVDLARARMDQAEAAAGELEENLARTVVAAPLTGQVGGRHAEVGMLVGPSTRLFTLGQLDSVRVQVVLTDRMLAYIETGQAAAVSIGDTTRPARLSRISPFLNPVSHSTEAELDLANPGGEFKPGMFVTVDIFHGDSEEATLVPLSAIYEDPATGEVGTYVTAATIDANRGELELPDVAPLTEPVTFTFVPAGVVARSALHAAVDGVAPGAWVVTLGQNLLGSDSAEARVRPVEWDRVERLQRLQREDLMQEVIQGP